MFGYYYFCSYPSRKNASLISQTVADHNDLKGDRNPGIFGSVSASEQSGNSAIPVASHLAGLGRFSLPLTAHESNTILGMEKVTEICEYLVFWQH